MKLFFKILNFCTPKVQKFLKIFYGFFVTFFVTKKKNNLFFRPESTLMRSNELNF